MLSNVGMSSRPAYYSGRGATLSDLNSEKLLKIQSQIEKKHGKDASKAFVNMIQSMSNLNATDFIENLYMLERKGWVWDIKSTSKNGFDFDKNKDGSHNESQLMASLFSAMGNKRDETHQIKSNFLLKNGIREVLPIFRCW